MNVKPILFSAPMISALLDGRKTQTRRVVKLSNWMIKAAMTFEGAWIDSGFGDDNYMKIKGDDDTAHRLFCPYGQKGDLLWVRENFAYLGNEDDIPIEPRKILYTATDDYEGVTKPSIFMPRHASRLTLKINNVRVEHLQSITYIDAKNEGVSYIKGDEDPRDLYKDLWQSINGEGSWDLNPWVWVIEFEVIQQNVDEYLRRAA